MGRAGEGRVLAVMGSGETSPTMVTVHRALAARLPGGAPRAVLLETPYAFQENAADVSARACDYFARSVGLTVTVLTEREAAPQDPAGRPDSAGSARDAAAAAVLAADWVFCGPGSPSYALDRWRESGLGRALRDRVATGAGVTVLASAAAATIGRAAVPVYEIYKAGAPPHWLDGLDLLGGLGLQVQAVIPHYDNAEGGTHDTRYCYLGERRLARMERDLPPGAAVLGVDEHTAAIFDLDAGTVDVAGRGGVTVRRAGCSAVLPAGTRITLDGLRDLAEHGPGRAGTPGAPAGAPAPPRPADTGPGTLMEITGQVQRRFDHAAAARDLAAMAGAILDLEAAISEWSADTEEDQGTAQARTVLRGLVVRLARAGAEPPPGPPAGLGAAVGPLLALRTALRDAGAYPAADTIRGDLAGAGERIEDTAGGPRWSYQPPG